MKEPQNPFVLLLAYFLSMLINYPFTSYILWVLFGVPLGFWQILLVSLFALPFATTLTVIFWILGAIGIQFPFFPQALSILMMF